MPAGHDSTVHSTVVDSMDECLLLWGIENASPRDSAQVEQESFLFSWRGQIFAGVVSASLEKVSGKCTSLDGTSRFEST